MENSTTHISGIQTLQTTYALMSFEMTLHTKLFLQTWKLAPPSMYALMQSLCEPKKKMVLQLS
jgi:hypothetical protein